MKIQKEKKIFFLLASLMLVGFLYAPPAHAFLDVGFVWDGIVGAISSLLFSVILTPLTWILAWAGTLVNYALQPDNLPLTTAANTFVQTGWTTMRDLTNMLFILIMLAIALDYILFNSVGVKRAIPRLLLVALLINFSLPIAGVVIDFANVFTDFFMKQAGGNQFSEILANKMGLVNIFNISMDSKTIVDVAGAQDGALATVIFGIFFTLGTVFIFLALAAMFFIRYFYLSILLIVLPLVLVVSILPQFTSHYRKWVSKFISWTMFAPAAAFFLYLSMVFLDSQIKTFTAVMGDPGAGEFLSGIGTQITTFVFAWMLMIMSLFTAQKMGIAGASTAIATWSKGTKWMRGKGLGATKALSSAAGRRIKADEQVEKLAQGLRNIPALGGVLSSGVRSMGVKTKLAMEKQEAFTTQEKAQYEKYSDAQLQAEYKAFKESKIIPGAGAKAAQIAEILARKGSLTVLDENGNLDHDKTPELVKEAYALAKTHKNRGAMDAIMKANPIVYQQIVEKEWEELASKDKLAGVKYDYSSGVARLSEGQRKDTGETLESAQNKAFEKMTSTDFENLKGAWDEKATHLFLLSGAMGSNHIRMASNANDHDFIKHVSANLSRLSEKEIELLQKKSPALISFLTSGRASDFINVPESFKSRFTEEGAPKEKKQKEEPAPETPKRRIGF